MKQKNYSVLVKRADSAFKSKRYLEAFLIQSCLFESVVKDYALECLAPFLQASPQLKSKVGNFEMARLTDELFIAGKINRELYEGLGVYRQKRNSVIHKILHFKDLKNLERSLRQTYESGVKMKVFIVEQLLLRKKNGSTSAELSASLERTLGEMVPEIHRVSMRELKSTFRKMDKDIQKILLKKESKNRNSYHFSI
jgi:hypothetical protein